MNVTYSVNRWLKGYAFGELSSRIVAQQKLLLDYCY